MFDNVLNSSTAAGVAIARLDGLVEELRSYYYNHAELPDYFHPEVVKLLLTKKTRGRQKEERAQEELETKDD